MDPRIAVLTVAPALLFTLIFGIVYLKSRENMALIERGINPKQNDYRPKPFINLKYGLLLVGAGIGLLSAYFVDMTVSHTIMTPHGEAMYNDNPSIYFALIAIGGGAGLVLSYMIEKKHSKVRD